MINKPKSYDDVNPRTSFSRRIKDGYYKGIITNVEVKKMESKKGTEFEILSVSLDVDDGEFKNYYKEKYDENKNENKGWGLTKDLFLENESNSDELNKINAERLKTFVTCVEDSNLHFKFDWNEKTLIGKKVGFALGLKEFKTKEGPVYTTPDFRFFCSYKTVDEMDYSKTENKLKVRTLDGRLVNYREYMNNSTLKNNETEGDFITIEDTDDIPF